MLQRVIGHGIAQALMDQKLCKTYKYLGFFYIKSNSILHFLSHILLGTNHLLSFMTNIIGKNVSEVGHIIFFIMLITYLLDQEMVADG